MSMLIRPAIAATTRFGDDAPVIGGDYYGSIPQEQCATPSGKEPRMAVTDADNI